MTLDISVIIINYNSENLTVDCIKSFLEFTSKSLKCEYIIVDNASRPKSYFSLKDYIKTISDHNIELIRSDLNTGFGGGNMIGFNKASGKYVAFVNNDTVLQNDCLTILKSFMENNKTSGICAPQAFKEDGKLLPTIDHFASLGREILGRRFLEILNPKTYPNRFKLYTEPQKGQFIAGSFMFLKTLDFETIGGFDENIFLYYEETDLCKRLLAIGKEAYVVPEAKFIHFHGASTPKSIAIKTELKISLLYVIRKHYGNAHHLILLNYLRLRYFFSSIFKPKYRPLFKVLLQGAPLSQSLKVKQNIEPINQK